ESAGMNIPTVGVGTVEKSRLVTTSSPLDPLKSNSTPPAVFGEENVVATMSSKACDCRGARLNVEVGAEAAQAPPADAMKQREVAVTCRVWVYDVLKARTSEKNGAPPTSDAAAGSVIRSARSEPAQKNPAARSRIDLRMENLTSLRKLFPILPA